MPQKGSAIGCMNFDVAGQATGRAALVHVDGDKRLRLIENGARARPDRAGRLCT
jgi:hypothetical protein